MSIQSDCDSIEEWLKLTRNPICSTSLAPLGSVLEYQTIAEAETALERLNAVDIKGVKPIVTIDDVSTASCTPTPATYC